MKVPNKKYDTGLGLFVIILLILAVVLFGFAFFAPLVFTKPSIDGEGFSDTGQIGDTIGGLMSPFINLSAVIVTGLAFFMQYRANKLQIQIFTDQLKETEKQFKIEQASQEKQNKLQQFESQFFEMLRLHKENVNELSITNFLSKETGEANSDLKIVNGRLVFFVMSEIFEKLLGYSKNPLHNSLTDRNFKEAYLIFFWGVNKADEIDKVFQNKLLGTGSCKDLTGFGQFENYPGLSFSLGHYFRHLYLTVKFVVNSSVVFDYESKMKYLKILRAQLSNHEQIMLFYNWLADYGAAWEDEENRFFTDYKMIHNLWNEQLFQDQYIVDKVNGLIDKYNAKPKKTPLFEFQEDDFQYKMKNIESMPLTEL